MIRGYRLDGDGLTVCLILFTGAYRPHAYIPHHDFVSIWKETLPDEEPPEKLLALNLKRAK
jgi:hypothetical protein